MTSRQIFAGLLFLAATPALANDTTAVLTTGGLEFVTNFDIVMESEELFISKDEIRVVYQFRNTSQTDQNILVAFPMPDIVPNWYSDVAYPAGLENNNYEFETTLNGKPIEATLHDYAYAFGVDRSKLLTQLGLPLLPITQEAREAADALDEETRNQLLHLGMLTPDEYDVGEGMEMHYNPAWTYKATYTWEGDFPAGELVTVEHKYKPSVGGTVGVTFLGEAYEGYDPRREYDSKYCTDEAFISAVRRTLKDPAEPYSAPFTESWISYILTTGGNWGGGVINNFRLVVDKGSEDNLISFCGDDVKKIGPTTFEMVKTDFWPDRELEILILNRNDW
ncbi:protein of unknown function [Devosia sp. YR412]|uniref:DUF4424 domain-containing protein n=1 Tax=Devosia sp. YR412 TaxID=1881030 RepID=UPI0008AE55F6|nr:DUF4424 domain-containing protein [Devosia sp. YR412]SEQ00554.1 protein of unknown function [Devosia sp. YR412]